MDRTIEHILRPEMGSIFRIQSAALKSLHDFMWKEGIVQLMPVMLSPFTDPLAHPVHDSSLEYEGQKLELTKSMILHKQLSMMRDDLKGIYIVSPNIRLEVGDTASSGRHLIEFSQADIELAGADYRTFMRLTERLYKKMITDVMKECSTELKLLGRKLAVPEEHFKVHDSTDLEGEFGEDWEYEISIREKYPFWVTDHYREFYDKEDPKTGKHVNYDLVYPEGLGEALSGGERETDYVVILKKMKDRKTEPKEYADYLAIAERGLLKPTAGGGFGVERLVRYLTGKKHIREITPFPRVPGERIVI